jgi:LEA14-like dessication related protein
VKKIYTLLAIVTGVYLIKKIHFAKKIDFELIGINFSGSLLNPLLLLKIKVINPTGTTAEFKSLTGDVSLNKNKIGVATLNNPILIAANTSTILTINIKLDSINLFQNVIVAITNKTGIINLTGSAKIDSFTLPINYDYKL